MYIDSSLRASGSAENFTFNLPYLITNIKSIQPVYSIFPNNIYTVSAVNNQFNFNIAGIDRTIQITPGTYNITSLINSLNALGAVSNTNFFYDPLTLKISITNLDSIPFQIQASSTMLFILGFTSQYNFDDLAIVHISNSVVKINNTYDYIHITMDLVQQYYGTTLRNYLATIPIASIPSGTVQQINFPEAEYIARKSFAQ